MPKRASSDSLGATQRCFARPPSSPTSGRWHWYGSAPRGADAVGTTCDLDLIGDLQALAVEADHGERVVHHALRQQGLAVMAPRHALRPLPDFDFGHLSQGSLIHAEHDQQAVIVVERMARRQI